MSLERPNRIEYFDVDEANAEFEDEEFEQTEDEELEQTEDEEELEQEEKEVVKKSEPPEPKKIEVKKQSNENGGDHGKKEEDSDK